MSKVAAWVASAPKSKFIKKDIDFGPLGDEEWKSPLNIAEFAIQTFPY